MSEQEEERWVVTDIETNGLQVAGGQIYEVAMIVVDPMTLEELGRFKTLVTHPVIQGMSLKVLAMHTKTGLLAELSNPENIQCSPGSHSSLDFEICYFLRHAYGQRLEKIKLAGNSVNFDHAFLSAHCPDFGRTLHHRTINCSTIRDTLKLWHGINVTREGTHHRAMSDAEYSLELLRVYKRVTELGAGSFQLPQ